MKLKPLNDEAMVQTQYRKRFLLYEIRCGKVLLAFPQHRIDSRWLKTDAIRWRLSAAIHFVSRSIFFLFFAFFVKLKMSVLWPSKYTIVNDLPSLTPTRVESPEIIYFNSQNTKSIFYLPRRNWYQNQWKYCTHSSVKQTFFFCFAEFFVIHYAIRVN